MDEIKPRSDEENARQLAAQMEIYQKLRNKKAICENEVQRLEADLKAAQGEAEEKFGTSDVAKLRKEYQDGQVRNTRAVQEFTQSLEKIEQALAEITAEQTEIGVGENPRTMVFSPRK